MAFFAAEWAMDAEPTPASLENAARWKPMISAPMRAAVDRVAAERAR